MKKLIILVVVIGAISSGLYFTGSHQMILAKLGMGSGGDEATTESTDNTVESSATPEPEPTPIAAAETTAPASNSGSQRKYSEKPGFQQWGKYKQILIDPVKVNSSGSAIADRDQQMLGDYFYNAMRNAAQRRYRVVNAPGPDVLRVNAVIQNVTGGASQGTVTMQGQLLDSLTGEQLVAIEDSKSGSLLSSTALWGDITKGFDNWAEQLAMLLGNKLGDVHYGAQGTTESDKIAALLADAEQDLFSNRLTSPPNKNALSRYRQVLTLDETNVQAKKGIEKIVKKYAAWGERAVTEGNLKRAWVYLDNARDILDEHPAVQQLAATLRTAVPRTASSSASAVIASPAPVAESAPAPTPEAAAPETAAAPEAAAPAAAPETAAAEPAAPAAAPVIEAADPWGGQPGKGSASFSSGALKPFMLGLDTTGDIKVIATAAKTRLKAAGFDIAGEYSPYPEAQIVTATSAELKGAAAKSEFGGYGAVVRVAVTAVGERVQVAYTNPVYLQHIYRMSGDLSAVATKLGAALGHEKAFGSKSGIEADKLKKWHYMMGMPYFDDADKLGSGSQDALVSKIESSLGSKKVYRIDIPGKQETLFGVAIDSGKGADSTVMKSIDTGEDRHTAHLPYEILVSGGTAYALNGKFRIALSFPDLSMGQFGSISSAPGAIEDALKAFAK